MIKETERRLKVYFKNKEELDYLYKREKIILKRIEQYKQNLKECNIDLKDTLVAIDYAKEYIQTNDTTSNIERMLIRETDKILKDIQKALKDKYICRRFIKDIEKQIVDFEVLISKTVVDENDIKLLELYYGKWKWTDEMLANRSSEYISRATMQRKRLGLLININKVV